MSAKDLRYEITNSYCQHMPTETTRGKWVAAVRVLENRKDGSIVASASGLGKGAAPRVAMREAINDAFGQLALSRKQKRETGAAR